MEFLDKNSIAKKMVNEKENVDVDVEVNICICC